MGDNIRIPPSSSSLVLPHSSFLLPHSSSSSILPPPSSIVLPPSSFILPLVHTAADHFVHVWRLRRVIDPLIDPLSPSQRYKHLGWRNAGDFEEDYPIKGMARCGEKLLMAAGVNIYQTFTFNLKFQCNCREYHYLLTSFKTIYLLTS